jgi:hypothetical protein
VANGLDADLFEIVSRQVAQDVEVDAVLSERPLIGLQTEAAEPLPDV